MHRIIIIQTNCKGNHKQIYNAKLARVKNENKDRNHRSSYKEHREDALAPRADEGRSELRKATVSRKQTMTRGCPNGETRHAESMSPRDEYIVSEEGTR